MVGDTSGLGMTVEGIPRRLCQTANRDLGTRFIVRVGLECLALGLIVRVYIGFALMFTIRVV